MINKNDYYLGSGCEASTLWNLEQCVVGSLWTKVATLFHEHQSVFNHNIYCSGWLC